MAVTSWSEEYLSPCLLPDAEVVKNKQVLQKCHANGTPKESDFAISTDNTISLQVPEGSNGVLLKNRYLSCDPFLSFLMQETVDPSFQGYEVGSWLYRIRPALAMATLQPSVGGLPPPPFTDRSFATMLKKLPTPPLTASLASVGNNQAQLDPAKLGTHKGHPAIFITNEAWSSLAKPFEWALVGKFSRGYNKRQPENGRPPVGTLQNYFRSLDLKGDFLIQLCSEEDFLRLYSRPLWYVTKSVTMRTFKWTSDFHVNKESPLVPVWITLPKLPIHLFSRAILFQIGSLVGLPLRLDTATASLKCPSVARLQVELDLLKSRPPQIWIGRGERDGFWQSVEYENVPPYCQHCWHVGHAEQFCRIHNPEMRIPTQNIQSQKGKGNNQSIELVSGQRKQPEQQNIVVPISVQDVQQNHQAAQHVRQVDTNSDFIEARMSANATGNQEGAPAENHFPGVATGTEDTSSGAPVPMVITSHVDSVCQKTAKTLNVHSGPVSDVAAVASTALEVEGVSNVAIVPMVSTHNEGTAMGAAAATMSIIAASSAAVQEIEADTQATEGSAREAVRETEGPDAAERPSSRLNTVATQAIFDTLRSDLSIPPATTVEKVFNVETEASPRQVQYEHSLIATPLKGQNAGSPGAVFPKPVVFCGDETLSDATPTILMPPSFHPTYNFDAFEDDASSWRTVNSGEEDAEDKDHAREDSMEEFIDSHYVRDDEYLEQRRYRQVRRDRDILLMRRGRGRPLGSRNRTFSDEDRPRRQSARNNKGIPPKHFEPGL